MSVVLRASSEPQSSWSSIDKVLMAKRAGYSPEFLEALWESGQLAIHEMSTEKGLFGYLVTMDLNLGLGPFLHVLWCQVRPCKALRDDLDWLTSATEYLQRVAREHGCGQVRIAVAEDHPSPSWRWRLQWHGFEPLMTELGISVAQ